MTKLRKSVESITVFAVTGLALTMASTNAAASFTEDFADNSADPNMAIGPGYGSPTTDFTGDFTITSGQNNRIYLGTNDTDYSTVDFVFEAEVTVPNGNAWAIPFFGMGNTTPKGADQFGEPLDLPHVIMVVRNDGALLQSRDNAPSFAGPTEVQGLSSLVGNTHLLRLTWNSTLQSAFFEFDELNDGSIDGSFTLDGSDNGFNASNSKLFLGGGNGLTFDNISVTVSKPASLSLRVGNNGGSLNFEWGSQSGKVYDLLSSTDPSLDPETWPVVATAEGLAATPPLNTFTISRPVDSARFYVVRERKGPPIFSDDFESDQQWTTGPNSSDAGNTVWERGTPGSFVSNGLPPISGANGSSNCFGTNLSADYGADTDIYLRSPVIDLTTEGLSNASLTVSHYLDTDSPFNNDVGSIRVLKAGDLTQLGADLATDLNGIPSSNTDWNEVTYSLPTEALGQMVVLEFQFVSNDTEFYSGWCIDNVAIDVE